MVAVAGQQVDAHTAAILWARTEGNPFFLREMVGLLVSEQRLDEPAAAPVPVPVRDVVLRRVNRLPRDAVAVLSVAAIAGRHFCVDVVADAAAVDVEAALEAIDAAAAAGLVVENEQRLGWFSFTHALVAEALYTATGRLRGIRMHRRIAVAAARAWAGDDERAAEIARHWSLAAELDQATTEQAAGYAAAAARVADARLAPEDAAARWRQALDAAELAGNRVDCYPLLLALATSLYRAGHLQEGLPVFVHAMEQALDRDEPTRLITAALGAMGESNWYPVSYGVVDEGLVNVLDRALARLADPTQRALALSCLAAARYYDDSPLRRAPQSDEALTLARGLADDLCLAHVLRLRAMALRTPDYPMQCLAAATELLGLPGLPPRVVAGARLLRADSLVILGRVPEAATEVELAAPLVAQLRSAPLQTQLGWARASLLLLAGRWSQADARICATFDLHAPTRRFTALATRVAHRWEMAFLTGTGGDLIDDLRAAIDTTGVTALHSILAMALGVRRGDTVALMLSNRPEFFWVDVAAMHLGATTFGIYNTFAQEQLEYVLRDAGAAVAITEQAFAPTLQRARQACPLLTHLVSVDGGQGMLSLEEVDAAGDPGFALSSIWPVADQNDVVTLIYTSGTTGPPKGVQLTHAGVIGNARALHEAIPAYRAGFSAVSYLPLAHASARVMEHYYGLLLGGTLTCCPDLKDLGTALVETRPTWLFGPPRMWEKLQASVTAAVTVEADDQRRQAIEGAIETGLRLVRAQQTGEQPSAALLADYERADALVLSACGRVWGWAALRPERSEPPRFPPR